MYISLEFPRNCPESQRCLRPFVKLSCEFVAHAFKNKPVSRQSKINAGAHMWTCVARDWPAIWRGRERRKMGEGEVSRWINGVRENGDHVPRAAIKVRTIVPVHKLSGRASVRALPSLLSRCFLRSIEIAATAPSIFLSCPASTIVAVPKCSNCSIIVESECVNTRLASCPLADFARVSVCTLYRACVYTIVHKSADV